MTRMCAWTWKVSLMDIHVLSKCSAHRIVKLQWLYFTKYIYTKFPERECRDDECHCASSVEFKRLPLPQTGFHVAMCLQRISTSIGKCNLHKKRSNAADSPYSMFI